MSCGILEGNDYYEEIIVDSSDGEYTEEEIIDDDGIVNNDTIIRTITKGATRKAIDSMDLTAAKAYLQSLLGKNCSELEYNTDEEEEWEEFELPDVITPITRSRRLSLFSPPTLDTITDVSEHSVTSTRRQNYCRRAIMKALESDHRRALEILKEDEPEIKQRPGKLISNEVLSRVDNALSIPMCKPISNCYNAFTRQSWSSDHPLGVNVEAKEVLHSAKSILSKEADETVSSSRNSSLDFIQPRIVPAFPKELLPSTLEISRRRGGRRRDKDHQNQKYRNDLSKSPSRGTLFERLQISSGKGSSLRRKRHELGYTESPSMRSRRSLSSKNREGRRRSTSLGRTSAVTGRLQRKKVRRTEKRRSHDNGTKSSLDAFFLHKKTEGKESESSDSRSTGSTNIRRRRHRQCNNDSISVSSAPTSALGGSKMSNVIAGIPLRDRRGIRSRGRTSRKILTSADMVGEEIRRRTRSASLGRRALIRRKKIKETVHEASAKVASGKARSRTRRSRQC
jgi:hypothetical protein